MRVLAALVLVTVTSLGCAAGPSAGARGAMARASPDDGGATVSRAQPVARLEPAVVAMPRDAETSIADVARYIAEREPDQRARIKAMHDWVADRLTYDPSEAQVLVVVSPRGEPDRALCDLLPVACPPRDAPGLAPLFVPPSELDAIAALGDGGELPRVRDYLAERAFVLRRGVCAHYAALMNRLGAAVGEEIVYVRGEARTRDGAFGDHAWNVARIGDHYEPLDVTWDSGYGDRHAFRRHYSNDWLFLSPDEFITTHFPADARWQLQATPKSRSWFLKAERR